MGAQMCITNMFKKSTDYNILLYAGIKKVLSDGVQPWQLILVDEGDKGSKYLEQRAIIGPQGKLHFKGVRLQGR